MTSSVCVNWRSTWFGLTHRWICFEFDRDHLGPWANGIESVLSGNGVSYSPRNREPEGGPSQLTTTQVMFATPSVFSNRKQWRACERQSNSQSPTTPLLPPAS